ncbi:SPOR domain-containing protein [Parapedobacter sp. GCM10030251]|uniref:SPOR domain-containing protein n=1 Tax=Parapedobacter sp. GCM10030251 TaxID=3273419 RepID=UPI003620A090
MNLGLCIANLLRRYPAVEVPGIGVFTITRMPASYDKERSVLLPPASYIELTDRSADFFSIVTYLRAQAGVDEAAAKDMLEQAVREIKDAISRQGQALLDGVGYLVADGASLVFKPFATGRVGARPVKVPRGEPNETAPVVNEPELVKEPELANEENGAVGLAEEATPGEIADNREEVLPSQRKNNAMRWGIAAALVLLVSAAGIAWYYTSGSFERKETAQLLEPKETVLPADSAVDSTVDSTVDSVAIAQVDAEAADSLRADTSAAVVPEPVKPAVTYEIIVGSFATMAQARKYVADMKAKGYDLRALDSRMPGNRKKISWGSYATEEEAYRELARVQKNFEPGAWIAKVEND